MAEQLKKTFTINWKVKISNHLIQFVTFDRRLSAVFLIFRYGLYYGMKIIFVRSQDILTCNLKENDAPF